MKLNPAIQQNCICCLCYNNDPKGAAYLSSIIAPSEYDSYFRDIAESADRFRSQFGKVPGEHTFDIINTLKEQKPESAEIFDQIYQDLEKYKGELNWEYVCREATVFARRQRVKRGATKMIEHLQTGVDEDIDRAQQVMEAAFKQANTLFDPGTILSDHARSLNFLDPSTSEVFRTGIKELDQFEASPARGQMHLFLAPYNRGKSWYQIALGKQALLDRKKVLHISLEMSEEEVAKRYCQALFSISKRDQQINRMEFKVDELGRVTNWEQVKIEGRPNFRQPGIKADLIERLELLKAKPPIIIKRFPTGMLTMENLKRYLDSLEASQRFIPDLFVLDYPDLMDIDTRNYRVSIGKIYQQLRGISIERNNALSVPSQSNRVSLSAKKTTGEHVGEDISKMATADTCVTYSQTESELEWGMARLCVDRSRGDKKGFNILISQSYDIGQFCLESAMMSGTYWKRVAEEKQKNGDGDDDT